MRVDPYLMKCRGLTTRIRGDSSATGVKLRGPEGAQRLRATSASMAELCRSLFVSRSRDLDGARQALRFGDVHGTMSAGTAQERLVRCTV
jgi:hypothetical protein